MDFELETIRAYPATVFEWHCSVLAVKKSPSLAFEGFKSLNPIPVHTAKNKNVIPSQILALFHRMQIFI
jgi:hypothetical protein